MIECQCPRCNSRDTYSCAIAQAQGTATTETTTALQGRSMGMVYRQGGLSAIDAAHAGTQKSTAKSVTDFARRAAPPTNWFGVWGMQAFISAIAAVAVYFLHGLAAVIGVLELVAVPWLLVSVTGAVLTYPKREGYARAMDDWRRMWICARCGNKFIPQNVAVTL